MKVSAPLAKKATGTTSEESSRQATPQPTTTGTLKKSDSKPNLKREKSDIFKSFAKAKAKSKESTPAPVEDAPMQGMSEDEADDGEPEIKFDEEKAAQARKAREEREEKLRRMMEESGMWNTGLLVRTTSDHTQTTRCPTSPLRQRRIPRSQHKAIHLQSLQQNAKLLLLPLETAEGEADGW